MTNPTPHGQVPEALRLAERLSSNTGHVGGPTIDAAAAELRRLHAYCQELESQVFLDCMTHVQNPTEIEHVAGDVSKNGAEVNMMGLIDDYAEARHVGGCHTYNVKTAEARAKVIAALRTQQPAPSAAAVEHGDGFMEAINEMDELRPFQAAPQPSPTPQADSQPAPVRDERDDFEKVFPIPSGCVRCGTGYASTGYSNWAAHTHVERWEGWQARAARAPADSVTAPAEADMFWDAEDGERFGYDIYDIISDFGPGDRVKIDCAKRMPSIEVLVIEDGDDFTYQVISPTPPAEQQATKETSGGFHVWRDISTAPKDGSRFVATGHNYGLYSEVRHTCIAQWFRGCWMEVSDWNETSELKYLTHWMPLLPLPGNAARKQGANHD